MMKKLISGKKSSKNSDKLVSTDAVTLEENYGTANESSERTQSNVLSISPLSPERGLLGNSNSQSMSVRRPDYLLEEPRSTLPVHASQNICIYQSKRLHFGTSIIINNNADQQPSERRSTTRKTIEITRSIQAMMISDHKVTHKIMDIIATHLGEDWRCLFRSLGYSDGQIDQMNENYHINGVKEVIYRLLLDYSRNNDAASLGHITKAMWENGFKECVVILKKYFKNGKLTTGTSSGIKEKSDESSCSKDIDKCMEEKAFLNVCEVCRPSQLYLLLQILKSKLSQVKNRYTNLLLKLLDKATEHC